MNRPPDSEIDAMLLAYTTGEITQPEERTLFEAAAQDQDLFDRLLDLESARQAIRNPEERRRALAVLDAWGHTERTETLDVPRAAAALRQRAQRPPSLAADLGRSVVSTITTTVVLRLCYAAITVIGATFVTSAPSYEPAANPGSSPVPPILHLVHAAIAALLLAVQFTPFLQPHRIDARTHPIAQRCLAQFIAGWRFAWAAWLALYAWLWIFAVSGANPYPVADILNCLTAFPLFWAFFVLDQPSVAIPTNPRRTAAFRKAIGVVWGIGAGVAVLAVAGREHLWGLNEFGLVFQGIYVGLSIAFLFGRFDSHWMKVPRWMLAPLYGYALIQMIYVFFFRLPPEWQIYTYVVALLFKLCLFLVVTHLLQAGNLARYLEAAEDGKIGPPQ